MRLIFVTLILLTSFALAQAPQPPAVTSPDVQPDGNVTLRFVDPGAKEVLLQFEGEPKPLPMTRDEAGIWSITHGPLAPNYYGYNFIADGVLLMDPNNPAIKPNLLTPQNVVHVPGTTPQLWEVAASFTITFTNRKWLAINVITMSTHRRASIPRLKRSTPFSIYCTGIAIAPMAGRPWDKLTSSSIIFWRKTR